MAKTVYCPSVRWKSMEFPDLEPGEGVFGGRKLIGVEATWGDCPCDLPADPLGHDWKVWLHVLLGYSCSDPRGYSLHPNVGSRN